MKKFNESQAKDEISKIFNEVSFRKFGNAFRKHVNPMFKAEYNLACDGGWVSPTYPWSEVASYIIGDGDYSVNEEQFNNFINEFKK